MKTVRLLKPHTHAGQKLKPGAQLVLKDRTADWLVEQGVAVPVGYEVPALLQPPERQAEVTPPKAAVTAAPKRCCGWGR